MSSATEGSDYFRRPPTRTISRSITNSPHQQVNDVPPVVSQISYGYPAGEVLIYSIRGYKRDRVAMTFRDHRGDWKMFIPRANTQATRVITQMQNAIPINGVRAMVNWADGEIEINTL